MISEDALRILEDMERAAPKRLRRADVAALRKMHGDLMSRWLDGCVLPHRVTVYLPRDPGRLAMARLGAPTSHVTISGQWMTNAEPGIDIIVRAYPNINDGSMISFLIGEHRFRHDTGVKSFTREVSRLVRLGLGYCARHSGLLTEILS